MWEDQPIPFSRLYFSSVVIWATIEEAASAEGEGGMVGEEEVDREGARERRKRGRERRMVGTRKWSSRGRGSGGGLSR
jgi:hypothetical protein